MFTYFKKTLVAFYKSFVSITGACRGCEIAPHKSSDSSLQEKGNHALASLERDIPAAFSVHP